MGIINREYYGRHQIDTGKYALKDQFIFLDGTDYVGPYHILPNGKFFTGNIPDLKSKQLIEKGDKLISKDVIKYNNIKNEQLTTHVSPISFFPIITESDLDNGYFERFFVQRRNNPENTIMEIDISQYLNIGLESNNISEVNYNSTHLKWYISNIEDGIKAQLNKQQVSDAEKKFKGLKKFITNYLEYSK
jgi:hypothetical protein